jgi:hypothetical protein
LLGLLLGDSLTLLRSACPRAGLLSKFARLDTLMRDSPVTGATGTDAKEDQEQDSPDGDHDPNPGVHNAALLVAKSSFVNDALRLTLETNPKAAPVLALATPSSIDVHEMSRSEALPPGFVANDARAVYGGDERFRASPVARSTKK